MPQRLKLSTMTHFQLFLVIVDSFSRCGIVVYSNFSSSAYCTQDQLIYSSHFVFFSFAPIVVVGAIGIVFFFVFSFFLLVVLIQIFAPLLFVVNCPFSSIVCY
jgi:heme O synthase-like polyprenyltransferase